MRPDPPVTHLLLFLFISLAFVQETSTAACTLVNKQGEMLFVSMSDTKMSQVGPFQRNFLW